MDQRQIITSAVIFSAELEIGRCRDVIVKPRQLENRRSLRVASLFAWLGWVLIVSLLAAPTVHARSPHVAAPSAVSATLLPFAGGASPDSQCPGDARGPDYHHCCSFSSACPFSAIAEAATGITQAEVGLTIAIVNAIRPGKQIAPQIEPPKFSSHS